jgi:hypothetical protein
MEVMLSHDAFWARRRVAAGRGRVTALSGGRALGLVRGTG